MKRVPAVLVVAAGLAALAGCPQPLQPATVTPRPSPAAPTPLTGLAALDPGTPDKPLYAGVVHQHGHAFTPAVVYVLQGGSVTWVNDDTDPMGVVLPTLPAGPLTTDPVGQGADTGKITFASAGEFNYRSAYDTKQTGKVEVVPITGTPVPTDPPTEAPTAAPTATPTATPAQPATAATQAAPATAAQPATPATTAQAATGATTPTPPPHPTPP